MTDPASGKNYEISATSGRSRAKIRRRPRFYKRKFALLVYQRFKHKVPLDVLGTAGTLIKRLTKNDFMSLLPEITKEARGQLEEMVEMCKPLPTDAGAIVDGVMIKDVSCFPTLSLSTCG